ncbi:MAG TPA: hypothetical protein ENI79_03120 [Rhodospirillales bacterium]|nr:hypothetical protein [Rhodospirillales bacterium]
MQPAPLAKTETRDWIPIERVAELTGLTTSSWRKKAAALADQGKARLQTNTSGTGRPTWYFHRTVHARLGYLRREGDDAISVRALSGDFAEKDVKRAERKLHWIRRYRDACDNAPFRRTKRKVVADVGNLPSMDDEFSALRDTIDLYHAESHSGDGMNGMTPRAAWASKPAVVRIAPDGVLDLLTSVRGVFIVAKNGVTITVAGERVGYGQYDVKLRSHFGKKVLVAVDPQRIDEAVIMTAESGGDRRVICRVTRNKTVSPCADSTEQDLREAVAEMRKSRREMHNAVRSAPTRMKTASRLMDENRRKRAVARRATGTHGKPEAHPDQTFRIVQTGIDVGSIDHRATVEPPPETPAVDFYDDEIETVEEPPTADAVDFLNLYDSDTPAEADEDVTEGVDFWDDAP